MTGANPVNKFLTTIATKHSELQNVDGQYRALRREVALYDPHLIEGAPTTLLPTDKKTDTLTKKAKRLSTPTHPPTFPRMPL